VQVKTVQGMQEM